MLVIRHNSMYGNVAGLFSPYKIALHARGYFATRSKRDHALDDRTYSTVGSTGCPVLYSAIPVKHGTRIPHIMGSVHYPWLACIRDPLHGFTGPYVCAVFHVRNCAAAVPLPFFLSTCAASGVSVFVAFLLAGNATFSSSSSSSSLSPTLSTAAQLGGLQLSGGSGIIFGSRRTGPDRPVR